MQTFFMNAIVGAALLVAVQTAEASISVTLYDFNPNVLLMKTTGRINTDSLTGTAGNNWYSPGIHPSTAQFANGKLTKVTDPNKPPINSTAYLLTGPSSLQGNPTTHQPSSYPSLSLTFAVLLDTQRSEHYLVLPDVYRSGGTLESNVYFPGYSIKKSNIGSGPHVWTLQNGETITLSLGQRSDLLPEPGAGLIWSVLAGLGLAVRRRK